MTPLACALFSPFVPSSKIYRTRLLPPLSPRGLPSFFSGVILLKNVGDSPFSVRFCRKFAPLFLHAILNFP